MFRVSFADEFINAPAGSPKARLQLVYALIRLCTSQQLSYHLRTTPPSVTALASSRLDIAITNTILRITNSLSYLPPSDSENMRPVLNRFFMSLPTTLVQQTVLLSLDVLPRLAMLPKLPHMPATIVLPLMMCSFSLLYCLPSSPFRASPLLQSALAHSISVAREFLTLDSPPTLPSGSTD